MLRSIPPQNRQQSLDRFSSMRAASRSGLASISSQSIRPAPAQKHKQIRVILSNPAIKQQEQVQGALRQRASQLEEQIATAETPEELSFWQAALTRLKGK